MSCAKFSATQVAERSFISAGFWYERIKRSCDLVSRSSSRVLFSSIAASSACSASPFCSSESEKESISVEESSVSVCWGYTVEELAPIPSLSGCFVADEGGLRLSLRLLLNGRLGSVFALSMSAIAYRISATHRSRRTSPRGIDSSSQLRSLSVITKIRAARNCSLM